MSENAFTQAEAALVDKIVEGLQTINWHGNNSAKGQYIESMASLGVLSYARPNCYIAAVDVIQLVKERLNG
jgi:hypothetical protein